MQDDCRYAAAVAAGRREALDLTAAGIRRKIALYRNDEAKRGLVVGALLWSFTERWIARLEAMAAELEQQAAGLRRQEVELAAAPLKPVRSVRSLKTKRARSR